MTDESNLPAPERTAPEGIVPAANGPHLERPAAEEGIQPAPVPTPTAIRPASITTPAPVRGSDEPDRSRGTAHEVKDGFREIVETVVFVVVLVLLLKGFLAEAFVIPTGSMATTLYGYHQNVTCPDCGYNFPINMSPQLDPETSIPQTINGCTCPNCLHPFYLPGFGPAARDQR